MQVMLTAAPLSQAIAYWNLSHAYRDLGRLDEAAAACKRCVKLQPSLWVGPPPVHFKDPFEAPVEF